MLIGAGERAVVRLLIAGEEPALEIKINEYLEAHPDEILADLQVSQVQYHGRLGQTDFGFCATLVLRVAAR
jgi:hypothetical protein